MGKKMVFPKMLKMGDGKNDGKRKKQENWRWEKGWKTKKSRKQQMGKTMGKSQSPNKKKDGTRMELSSMEQKGWEDFENQAIDGTLAHCVCLSYFSIIYGE